MELRDSSNLPELDLTSLEQQGMRFWLSDGKVRFDAPAGTMSDQVRQLLSAQKTHIVAELTRRNLAEQNPFPLTGMQQAYWIGQSGALPLSTQARFYVELETDAFAADLLSAAINRLVAQHGMLRAVISATGEQQVLPQVPPYQTRIHHLDALDNSARAAALHTLRNQIRSRAWPASQWPQFDIQASQCGARMRLHLHFALWMADGISIQIVIGQLLALCAAPSWKIPDCDMSFARYAEAQDAVTRSPAYQAALRYWQHRIPDFPAAPPLPQASMPEHITKPSFRRLSATLAPRCAARLREQARKAGLSPTFALCAAYAEVLARFACSDHFALTVLYSDRDDTMLAARNVIGNFSRTLLLEVKHTPQDTFGTRAQALQARFWEDLEHSEMSGIEVGRELNRVRGSAAASGFPVTFTAVPSLLGAPHTTALHATLDHMDCHLDVPQVHLDHQVYDGAHGELILNWDYLTDLYPEGLIEHMFSTYVALAERLANDEATWHSKVLRLHGCLPQCPPADTLPANDELLHSGFERMALACPGQLAVIAPGCEITYGQLREQALALANTLCQHGAQPNQLIAVVMDKGWEQVVAVLAILYAGAAYVPIDPALPAVRQQLLQQESRATLVLTQRWLVQTQSWPDSVVCLCVGATPASAGANHPPVRQAASDLAYVIFTSGSTGKPKGVMIDHRGAVNTVQDINTRFAVTPQDRIFAISSLSFDLSVYDIFGPLAAGAALVMPHAALSKDPFHWLDMATQHGVTLWNSVPALAQLLEECALSSGIALPALRLIMMSGDWIPLSLPPRLRARFAQARLISMGGATEASIWSIWHEIDRIDPGWHSIPYGKALLNQSMHVLDAALDECPPWVTGDIYIGGIGLACGYWQDPVRSAAAFIRHPVTGERLYKTGDLGRYRADGEMEFLGRQDFQVKIQGYRIECAEIEAALLEQCDVAACVVNVVTDLQGAKRLAGYLVPAAVQAQAGLVERMRETLRARLPAYMVPSHLVLLDTLPLSANGKVDRKRLPAPAIDADNCTKPQGVAARDALEQQLLSLWSELLGIDVLSIHDDFFDLGGSSFTGMRLMAKLREQCGASLALGVLVQHPTVERLANHIRQPHQTEADPALIRLQAGDTGTPIFCIHPVGGNVLCYLELARCFGQKQAVYGLQAPALAGAETALHSIADMAARYLETVRAVQPQGPYRLGGWSLGGAVAYDMACQLHTLGEQVEIVFMIDTHLPGQTGRAQDDASLLAAFTADICAVARQPACIDAAELAGLPLAAMLEKVFHAAAAQGIALDSSAHLARLYHVFKANLLALDAFQPRPYDGHLLLLNATEERPLQEAQANWQLLARQLRVQDLPGNHYRILGKENLPQIAAMVLTTCSNEPLM